MEQRRRNRVTEWDHEQCPVAIDKTIVIGGGGAIASIQSSALRVNGLQSMPLVETDNADNIPETTDSPTQSPTNSPTARTLSSSPEPTPRASAAAPAATIASKALASSADEESVLECCTFHCWNLLVRHRKNEKRTTGGHSRPFRAQERPCTHHITHTHPPQKTRARRSPYRDHAALAARQEAIAELRENGFP